MSVRRNTHRVSGAPLALLVAALAALASSAMPLRAQTLAGSLVAEADRAPIVGARVRLLTVDLDEVAGTVTDSSGAFELSAGSGGVYVVHVEGGGLDGFLSDPIVLSAGQFERLDLVVPVQPDPADPTSIVAETLAAACTAENGPDQGVLYGVVVDSISGVGIAEARVQLATPGHGTRATVAKQDGIYVFCQVPTGARVEVRAQAGSRFPAARRVALVPGESRRLDVALGVSTSDAPASVLGRVVDYDTGEPLADAEVRLRGTELVTATDANGFFRLDSVPWGVYVVEVDHLGHAHQEQALRIEGGRAHDLRVRLPTEAIALDPITVEVKPRRWFGDMARLQQRMAAGFGTYLTREQIERRGAARFTDLFRGLPGVRLVQSSAGGRASEYRVVLRKALTLGGGTCFPIFWVDGRKVPSLGKDGNPIDDFFQPSDIEAVEIYRGPAQTPGEFIDSDANCGVVVVWTRRGR
ncbi:MAG: hypothetical protein D6701_11815 [Gemmatimonadetes bacterium]|nr:MAG: hypothetical protein D6701_11815 [Gemmatimonadota bacterium]